MSLFHSTLDRLGAIGRCPGLPAEPKGSDAPSEFANTISGEFIVSFWDHLCCPLGTLDYVFLVSVTCVFPCLIYAYSEDVNSRKKSDFATVENVFGMVNMQPNSMSPSLPPKLVSERSEVPHSTD